MELNQPQLLHPDRRPVTPLELFRGAEFAIATLASGAALSGGGTNLVSVTTSNQVRVKPLSVDVFNNEVTWVEVEFRDGGFAGGRVLGPYRVQPLNEIHLKHEDVQGAYFTSSVYAMVRSGGTAIEIRSGQGPQINFRYINDPQDFYE